jgi:hypothetical protein
MGPQVGILGFVLAAFCFSLSLQSEETLVPVLVWDYKNPGEFSPHPKIGWFLGLTLLCNLMTQANIHLSTSVEVLT